MAGLLDALQRGNQPKGTLSAYDPSWREKAGWAVGGLLEMLGADKYKQRYAAEKVGGLLDFLPGVGEALGVDDTKRAFNAGNYGEAAMNAGSTALGVVPGGGDLAAGVAKAIFGGIGAKTANKALLNKAQDMASSGAGKDAIWSETGWFKGPDDKWRFEIDDSQSEFRGLNPEPQSTPIRAALKHKELYDAYPDLIPAKVEERSLGKNVQGQYYGYEPGDEIIGLNWSGRDQHSTLLHEIMHGVQAREGFSKGAGGQIGLRPNTPAWDIYQERLKAIRTPMTEEKFYADGIGDPVEFPYSEYLKQHKASIKNNAAMLDRAAQETAVQESYRRSANEVESRNVQARMKMTQEQRRATPPWATQDVPDELQIIRRR